jgi:hypothetical protein
MLSTLWWNLVYGVENLIRWFPIIWRDRDWDQNYLLRMMEFKFKRMALLHETHGHLVRAPKTARQLRIAATLCRRLYEEPYYYMATFKYGRSGGKQWADHIAHLEKQDKEALGALISKYIDHWWD